MSHDLPEGEGVLVYSRCVDQLCYETDNQEIINDDVKHMTWNSPEVSWILKRSRNIRKGKIFIIQTQINTLC